MKILITGASGFLGNKIIELNKDYEIIGTYNSHPIPNLIKLNIGDKQEVLNLFNKIKPEVVIHTAAMTNIDECEINMTETWLTNAIGTHNIAMACKSKLIYISTACVFDGKKGNYKESDVPNPINWYGFTKLCGEYFIESCLEPQNYVILRTNSLYGLGHFRNFIPWIIESLRQNKEIEVVDDLYTTPTYIDNFVEIIFEIIERDLSGLYHASGKGRVSRYEIAKEIARLFNFDKNLIKPVKMNTMSSWIAKRPVDTSFDVNKIVQLLKTQPLNIRDGLMLMKES